ncbi:MAG: BatA domain-containing protein, partial [Henriciella sp.]|nr:BatA domain-containing protein [Henriciella sp.]
MTLGPFLFMAPLALLGLTALPVIWYILRATPPAPKLADLPSLRLLDDVDPREETPARTPWWLWLLRLIAATAVIIGLSRPIYAPGTTPDAASNGPVLVVVDDGWTSSQRWGELRSAAMSALDGEDRDAPAHVLLTAPRALNIDPAERLNRVAFEARVRSLQPQPWATDRADALSRLNESGLQPARILWLTDGLDPASAGPFARALAAKAPLSVYAAPPRGPAAISALSADTSGVKLTVRRAETAKTSSHFVSALTLDGAALATAEAVFAAGENSTTAHFTLPPAALTRIARFQVTGTASAGNVWLWDSADRSRRVGLVSGDSTAQPLLSDMHYIRKALEPFATITEGDLGQLIEDNPDAIILPDIGQIDAVSRGAVTAWVENGGALIRFAGPRMAAQGDDLVPAPLRRASREIGGALTWEEPQPLGAFPEASPFAGLIPPGDVKVRQQVLARPGPELSRRTWARLADGSPLVTADRRGEGTLILYHVTAGPDWSDLPYSGVFVDMLRRTIAAGQGEAIADEDGLYTPILSLSGTGRLNLPNSNATPFLAADLASNSPTESHP